MRTEQNNPPRGPVARTPRTHAQPGDRSDQSATLLGPVSGWLFFLAGLALLASVILIPASDDLADARWRRDRELARESHELERLRRTEQTADALAAGDPDLVRSLAQSQLNIVPPERSAIVLPGGPADPTLLVSLEPAPTIAPERPRVGSTLERLVTDRTGRLWVIAGSAVCVLFGLLSSVHPKR